MGNEINNNQELQSNLKGYILFWFGQLISLLGSSIIQFVLIWWVTVITADPVYLSLAAFIGFAPMIILTPLAGVLVDRYSRKLMIGTADFLQAVITVVLLFLFRNGTANLTIVLVFLGFRGVFQAFHTPSIQALIPIMIPRKHLNRFNSVDFLLNSLIFLIGPLVGAVLYANFQMSLILSIDAITFLIAVIPLFFIAIPKIAKQVGEKARKASFFAEFKEGVLFIRKKKGLLSLLSVFTAANLFIMPLFILINLFVFSNHSGTEIHLAYVLAFNQAGTIAGSILFIFWKGFKKKVVGVVLGIFVMYSGYLIVTLTPTSVFWFMGIGFLIIGFALPVANISSQTIWQSVVPKEKLGRVMSVRITIAQITGPVGMLVSGFIAKAITIEYLFISCVILGILFLAISWFFTSIKKVEDDIDYDSEDEPTTEIEDQSIEPFTDKEIETPITTTKE
ncbi:MAG: MFS transporter [Candidatus Heimdallarchaeota archaeon]